MGGFSLWHILIFAVILLLLFGGNRFSAMMGDVAKGLKSFKQGMADEDQANPRGQEPRQLPPQQPPYQAPPIDLTAQPRAPDPAPTAPPPPPPSDDSAR